MDEENSAIQCQCVEKGIRAYARHRRFTIIKLAVYKDRVKKNQTTSYLGIQTTMAAQYLSAPRDQPRASRSSPVIPLGRYTPEGQKATEKILTTAGERAREHMILLFTLKDDLDGMDFRDYLKQAPRAIQELIRKFRGRYCVFNNKATGAEQEDQREQLLTLVQDVVNKCKGRAATLIAGIRRPRRRFRSKPKC
ncbi:hypothetical protein R6Z07_006276 [Ovis aries]